MQVGPFIRAFNSILYTVVYSFFVQYWAKELYINSKLKCQVWDTLNLPPAFWKNSDSAIFHAVKFVTFCLVIIPLNKAGLSNELFLRYLPILTLFREAVVTNVVIVSMTVDHSNRDFHRARKR